MNHIIKLILSLQLLSSVCGAAPAISPDGTVRFQLSAPKAEEVLLKGDWGGGRVPMLRDANGVWTLEKQLEPQIYTYIFTVDGVQTLDPTNAQRKLGGKATSSSIEVPGSPPMLWEMCDVPHGEITTITYRSVAAGDQRKLTVYTPPGYRWDQTEKLPVLYLLHGNGGVDSIWVQHGRANLIADNLLAAGRMQPMIIVMPNGHTYPPGQVEVDGERPPSVFKEDLLETIVPLVEQRFQVKTDQPNRAIIGLSMGGGQSFRIGLGHLERFSHVGIFSASGRDPELMATLAADPDSVNEQLKLLWIACGRLDRGFERVEKMHENLSKAGIHHSYTPTDGGHTWLNWRSYLGETLPLLFQ